MPKLHLDSWRMREALNQTAGKFSGQGKASTALSTCADIKGNSWLLWQSCSTLWLRQEILCPRLCLTPELLIPDVL